ncbi:hypothetical protein LTR66_002103 [Elasticomyces elasticus]|nr:hypothetical protein LTR66_002103 [Elasticomyces elasticus]
MDDSEPFTLIPALNSHRLFDDYQDLTSAKNADHDVQYLSILRQQNPELIVSVIPPYNCDLLSFAAAGHADAELDLSTESIDWWRGYIPAAHRGGTGQLAESVFFAKYHYSWSGEDFILYIAGGLQYVLKEPLQGESQLGHSRTTDELITAIGEWEASFENDIWVYDDYWRKSKDLWKQVQQAEWENVILDEEMKKALVDFSDKFFDSKESYKDMGVPWKRGVIFTGPPGNGKTISIRALMHTLLRRKDPIPSLYVKSVYGTYDIREVFTRARRMAPCLLVFEDIETVVTEDTRSYFFNEVDGLENNDGLLMVASTNHLDQLDPGLSKRPSRFDRKYLFPLPSEHERVLYCRFWRNKLKKNPSVVFPEKLCPAIAGITEEFSFAYMQEAFVATLLVLARHETGEPPLSSSPSSSLSDKPDDVLDKYELWTVMKEQVKILRDDMDSSSAPETASKPLPVHGARRLPYRFASASSEILGRSERGSLSEDRRGKGRLNAQDVPVSLGAVAQKQCYLNSAACEWRAV